MEGVKPFTAYGEWATEGLYGMMLEEFHPAYFPGDFEMALINMKNRAVIIGAHIFRLHAILHS